MPPPPPLGGRPVQICRQVDQTGRPSPAVRPAQVAKVQEHFPRTRALR